MRSFCSPNNDRQQEENSRQARPGDGGAECADLAGFRDQLGGWGLTGGERCGEGVPSRKRGGYRQRGTRSLAGIFLEAAEDDSLDGWVEVFHKALEGFLGVASWWSRISSWGVSLGRPAVR